MRKHVLLLATLVWLGWLPAGYAQTPAMPTGETRFDGTYAFVQRTRLTETWVESGRMGPCSNPGPALLAITVVNGQARLSRRSGGSFTGTVGPNGELDMRYFPPAVGIGSTDQQREVTIEGKIDATGTIRARQSGFCQFDMVWQKVSR